jgi:hypothetical protein
MPLRRDWLPRVTLTVAAALQILTAITFNSSREAAAGVFLAAYIAATMALAVVGLALPSSRIGGPVAGAALALLAAFWLLLGVEGSRSNTVSGAAFVMSALGAGGVAARLGAEAFGPVREPAAVRALQVWAPLLAFAGMGLLVWPAATTTNATLVLPLLAHAATGIAFLGFLPRRLNPSAPPPDGTRRMDVGRVLGR